MRFLLLTAGVWALNAALARGDPPGTISPLAQKCGPSSGNIVCINQYAAVMPYHFFRNVSSNDQKFVYGDTIVPDSSFAQVAGADFLVFDQSRGLDLLGANPSYSFVFNVSEAVHEAPVYVPAVNKLYVSQLAPPTGVLPQLVIDLNQNPPTISNFLSDPPVYAPNGGTFHEGKVLWCASGGIDSIGGGGEQRPGLRYLDPATNKTTTILNNYFGFYFNTIDDVAVHPVTGDIWFTDPQYSWFNALTDTAPQLPAASYRFRPSTGAVSVISDDILQPNGITFTPDGKTAYISNTGAVTGSIDPRLGPLGSPFNATTLRGRSVYKYDVSDDATYLYNKRAIYLAQDWIADGLKVAQNGYVVTGAGYGVDILDADGTPLVRIQTNYTVQNIAWTGADLKTMWMVGNGGISKVEFNLQGQTLK